MTDTITISQEPTGQQAPQQQDNQQAPSGERPTWLPENFQKPEDMAQSYAEIRKAHTQAMQELAALKKAAGVDPGPGAEEESSEEQKPAEGEENKTEEKPEGSEEETEGDEETNEGPTEEEFAKYTAEFTEKGELSEDSYNELAEKYRIPKTFVDAYIEGQKALQTNFDNAVYNAAGGEEQFTAMVEWSKEGLSDSEKKVFKQAVESGDVNSALFAISGLKSKYEAANGAEPQLVNGSTSQSSGGYRSTQEMVKDQMDPRYKSDPAFRDAVLAKAKISNF